MFPPGYRFTPTDEELIFHYLVPFLQYKQHSFPNVPIHRVDIYETTPEKLTKEFEKGNAKEWFFITERTKRSAGGKRINRIDSGGGSWKAVTVAKKIEAGHGVVGYKTPLEYHTGNAKGDWIMHEYSCDSNGDHKVDHALCKIYLTAKGVKRRAVEEDNEKNKKKKIKIEEVDQTHEFSLLPLDSSLQQQQSQNYAHQPQQQQLQNVAYEPNQQELYLPLDLTSFVFELSDVNPEDAAYYFDNFSPHLLYGDEESSNFGYMEEIAGEIPKKHDD